MVSTNASTLMSLTLTSCPTMASSTCSELSSLTNLSELSLQHCPLSRDQLNSISWGAISGLRSLDLSHSAHLEDSVVKTITSSALNPLPISHLNLSKTKITDESLSLIRSSFGGTIGSLELDDCHLLTKAGLLVFFTPDSSLGPTVRLRRAVLSNLGPAVDDDVASAAFKTADVRGAGDGLTHVSVRGTKVSDRSMEVRTSEEEATS